MTVLVAMTVENGVVLAADKMNSTVDKNGEYTGTQRFVEKVASIRKNILISTGGISPLGSNIIQILQSTLGIGNDIPVKETIRHIEDTMQFAYTLFKKTNPDFQNPTLFFFVGIYDLESNKPHLYMLSDENNFKAVQIDTFGAVGPGAQNIRTNVLTELSRTKEVDRLPEIMATAIRKVDDPTVSKDTLTLISFYNQGDKTVNCVRVEIDKDGKVK